MMMLQLLQCPISPIEARGSLRRESADVGCYTHLQNIGNPPLPGSCPLHQNIRQEGRALGKNISTEAKPFASQLAMMLRMVFSAPGWRNW